MENKTILQKIGLTSLHLDAHQQKKVNGLPFPLVVVPNKSGVIFQGIRSVTEWMKSNKTHVENLLETHGAVLFREFPLESPEDFDEFVKSFGYQPVPYLGGAAPRNHVVGDVFTANEAPPSEVIYFHNEMAYLPVSPDCLFFYCDLPPVSGGETPIVSSKLVYQELVAKEENFLRKVEENGVIYSRVLPNGDDPHSSIGRGWQASFQVNTFSEAEKKVKEQNSRADWLPDGSLRVTSEVMQGVREDARSGEKVWFNTIISAYRNWKDSRNKVEDSVRFGDGTPMDPQVMNRLEEIMNNFSANFKWQKGDVLMLDNLLVLHGRRFFTPPRKILAALCSRNLCNAVV